MTVSERLFKFKSIDSLTMSKAAWYASMRHVRDYYSGQQCAQAGLNSIGLNLNSQRLAQRAEYKDVFCNPAAPGRL